MRYNSSAVVWVRNDTGSEAVIRFSHRYSDDPAQIWQSASRQTIAAGAQAGPLVVGFDTGLGEFGQDHWYCDVQILSGPRAGSYASEGALDEPKKQCTLSSKDRGAELLFSVSLQEFAMQERSGSCTTRMQRVGALAPSRASATSVASRDPRVEHVFVLMLENRSFDHMLGFSGLSGLDAETGKPTQIDGLTGQESNTFAGVRYLATPTADWSMPVGPGHEFLDALIQLSGPNAKYTKGGAYPPIDNSGFVADYVHAPSTDSNEGNAPNNFGEVMKCYAPSQLPVLNTLAREFAVCDRWFSALPGPTWPNRFFLYASTSAGMDYSPSGAKIILSERAAGYAFPNGTIFDALSQLSSGFGWKIYAGDEIPIAGTLKGITAHDIEHYSEFKQQIAGEYPWAFTLIEPSYGDVITGSFKGGNSQHPRDDVRHGEQLIKEVYEAIRNSAVWETSLLIVAWDEHGGFYDHVPPPSAVAPDDILGSDYGFTFEQRGLRVPAVIVSPFIPARTIDHRVYDHTSVPATLQALWGLKPLTRRDAEAANLLPLLSLTAPRSDAPTTLPEPAFAAGAAPAVAAPDLVTSQALGATSIEGDNLPGFLHTAVKHDLELSPPEQHPAIEAKAAAVRTRAQAEQYMNQVRAKINAARAARSAKSSADTPTR